MKRLILGFALVSLPYRASLSHPIPWKPKPPTLIVLFQAISRGAARLSVEPISDSTTLASTIKTCATVTAVGHSASGGNRDLLEGRR